MPSPRLLLLLVCSALGCHADVALSAFMQIGGRSSFVLTDLDDHASSGWLHIGDSFRGYRIESYNPRQEVLIVRRDGQRFDLRLKDSHVVAAENPLPPELVARGLTPADLIVRENGPVRITLWVGSIEAQGTRRFINVKFDKGADRAAIQFSTEGPQTISRSIVPEVVRESVSDNDIADINAHLAVVRGKWMQ